MKSVSLVEPRFRISRKLRSRLNRHMTRCYVAEDNKSGLTKDDRDRLFASFKMNLAHMEKRLEK